MYPTEVFIGSGCPPPCPGWPRRLPPLPVLRVAPWPPPPAPRAAAPAPVAAKTASAPVKAQPDIRPKPPAAKPADDTLWIHDDLDLDSLDLVDVVVIVDKNFGVTLTGPDFKELKTFRDFYDLIISRTNGK